MNTHQPTARKQMDVMTFIAAVMFVVCTLVFITCVMVNDVIPFVHHFMAQMQPHPRNT